MKFEWSAISIWQSISVSVVNYVAVAEEIHTNIYLEIKQNYYIVDCT